MSGRPVRCHCGVPRVCTFGCRHPGLSLLQGLALWVLVYAAVVLAGWALYSAGTALS